MAGRRIFDGIKVVDFGWIGVGPISASYLANHGAEVIRVEGLTRFDALRMAPPFKDKKPGINRSQFFASFNPSKKSFGLNMAQAEAQKLARRLVVEWADVVTEGFTPKNMKAWGLHYEDISKERPDIIYLSTCQLGQSGPYSMYAGYGNLAASLAGYYEITGWPDRDPVMVYGAYTDMITPHFNALSMAAALDYRRRTGKGMWIDNAQLETGIQCLAPAIMDYAVNGRIAGRRGNREDRATPHGAYRCLGADRWVNICVFTDEEWQAFCQVIGEPAWTKDPKFSTFLGRKQNEDDLDRLVEEWTQNYDAKEVQAMMQAAGVTAGLVSNQSDLHDDPQAKHRGFFVWRDVPGVGPMPYDGLQFELSKTPGEVNRFALVGEHNEYILKDILKLSDDEVGDLMAGGVTEMELSGG